MMSASAATAIVVLAVAAAMGRHFRWSSGCSADSMWCYWLHVALVGLCRFVVCAFGVVTDVMQSFDVAVESVVLRASSVDWCTVPVFDMVTCAMGVAVWWRWRHSL